MEELGHVSDSPCQATESVYQMFPEGQDLYTTWEAYSTEFLWIFAFPNTSRKALRPSRPLSQNGGSSHVRIWVKNLFLVTVVDNDHDHGLNIARNGGACLPACFVYNTDPIPSSISKVLDPIHMEKISIVATHQQGPFFRETRSVRLFGQRRDSEDDSGRMVFGKWCWRGTPCSVSYTTVGLTLSKEETLQIEYIESVMPPQKMSDFPQDDWVSSVSSRAPGYETHDFCISEVLTSRQIVFHRFI